MALNNNDRLQEFFLLIGDKLLPVSKKWWYALGLTLILLIPFYYLAKASFVGLIMQSYQPPQIVYSEVNKQPLQIMDKNIFTLPNNAYSGYVKIKNINLEWGVAQQEYTVEFKTLGGTTVTQVSGSAFILPSSEKLIVFSRFTSQTKPEVINVTLGETHFTHNPDIAINLNVERTNLQNNSDGLVVSAGIKNMTAFTVKKIDLPVAVYNNKNQIVAVNFTYINDILSGETRTFQYFWSSQIPGAVRAELNPEVNVFDRNIFSTPPSTVQPFNVSQ